MKLKAAIHKLNPSIVSTVDLVGYDSDGNVVEYDLAAAQALVVAEAPNAPTSKPAKTLFGFDCPPC